MEDELLSLQAELESGLTELGQTEAKRLEALQVRITVSFFQCFAFFLCCSGQCFWSVFICSSILGCIPIRIRIQGFYDQKLKTFTGIQKLNIFWSKIAIYLSLGLHKGRPSYRRSLQPSKEKIQHFKTWNFSLFFFNFRGSFCSPSWIRIRIPNLDRTRINWPDWFRIEDLFISTFWETCIPRRWLRRGYFSIF